MKMNKGLQALLAIGLILSTLALIFGFIFWTVYAPHAPAVQGAGQSTMTINCTQGIEFWTTGDHWTIATHTDQASQTAAGLWFGYEGSGTGADHYIIYSSIAKFDLTTAPAISQISSVKIKLYCLQKSEYNTPTMDAPYYSFYDTSAGADGILNAGDIDQFNDGQKRNRLTEYYDWSDLTLNAWQWFTVTPADWGALLTPDSGNNTFVALVSEQQALDNIPTGTWGEAKGYRGAFDTTGAHACALVIEYAPVADPIVFTYDDNGAVDNVTSGDEVADNITLRTLSCMYANENLEFDVSGESGAPVSLVLVNSSGETLASITDSVRLNNGVTTGTHYYWTIDSLAETYTGFVQCKELTYGLTSPWVRVEAQVDTSEENLNIYSRSTIDPQYTEDFSSYVVNRGNMMVVHWKTNIDPDVDDLSDIYLEIYDNGDNVTPAYSVSLADLQTNYYRGSPENNDAGINWRFALFTPKTIAGTNTYGGLVNNLNLDFVPDNKGYLQPMIRDVTDGELVATHSAYWYLTSAIDGVGVKMVDTTVKSDQEIGVTVTIGRECNVENYLKYVIVSVLETGVTTTTFVVEGDNVFYLDSIETEGDYTLQVALGDDSITSYQYIYQIPFSVTATGIAPTDHPTVTSTDIWDWITDIMHKWHLDTTGGHWLLILIGMGVMLLIGYKTQHKTIGLTGALLVFALGIVVGWIDWWWIVLLALGAGFTVWQYIRGKASGSGAG